MSREYEQEYFEQNYRNYARQNPPTKLRFYRNLLESAAPGRTQRRILDIGCAFGVFLGGLDDSWEKFGIDQSQFAIERARHNLPDSTLRVGTATDIPYEGPFDAIVSFDCLEHVEDLDAVRRTISTHLAPDGAILFVVPVYDGPTGPVIRMLDKDPTHVHKRDRWFWIDWAQHSFSVVDWWGIYRYLMPGGVYAHLPTHRFRRWTPAIAVVAQQRTDNPLESTVPSRKEAIPPAPGTSTRQ